MCDNRFDYVMIFDSIPEGELKIANRLYEDLKLLADVYPSRPGIEYRRVENKYQLFDYLKQLQIHSKKHDTFPLLHIESHGYKDGLQLADNSSVSWECLKERLIPLNISMRLNLMVILSSCFGGELGSTLDITDRAPVWGLIGPTQEISVGEVEKIFYKFYQKLFSTGSTEAAINTFIDVSPNDLYINAAEDFFYKVWQNSKEKICPKRIKGLARKMRKKMKKEKKLPLPTVAELKNKLSREVPDIFNMFRDRYFMCDLFPENKERFLLAFEKLQASESR